MTTRPAPLRQATAWLAAFGFVANLLSLPLHVALENHCRVIESSNPAVRLASDHRGDCSHGLHHHHHHDAASSEHDADCDCDSHCPHPIQEHVAEMKGEPTRGPSSASFALPILTTVTSVIVREPLPASNPFAEFRDLPPPDPEFRTSLAPRAPPTA